MRIQKFLMPVLAALVCITSCEKSNEPSWDAVEYEVQSVGPDYCHIDLSANPADIGEGNKVTVIAVSGGKPDVSKWTNLNSTHADVINAINSNFSCPYVCGLYDLTPETQYYIYITLVAEDQTILKISKPIVITTIAPIDYSGDE